MLSSGFWVGGGEVSVVSDHGVVDVGLAAGEADECGVVPLALGSFAVVVGPGFGVGSQGCERGHEQGVFQSFVASSVDVLAADAGARSSGDGRESGVGREVGGGGECGDVAAGLCQEPCGDPDADSWHRRQDFGKRVGIEDPLDVFGDLLALVAELQDLVRDPGQDLGGRGGAGNDDGLGGEAAPDLVGEAAVDAGCVFGELPVDPSPAPIPST